MTRPVSVITGPASGIGRYIALGLARAGHHVVLVARTWARAVEAADWIRLREPGASLQPEGADLSLLAETAAAGRRIAQAHPAIAVLVNNAGIFSARRRETAEGQELVLATNFLAPLVLIEALLPSLLGAPAARIVNIGSSTSDRARIDPDDLPGARRWGMQQAYAQSKLALLMATITLAERLSGTGVTANTVHPGAVATSLIRERGAIGLAWRVMAPFLLSEEQGAETPLHVALSAEFAGITGAYVKKRKPVAPNPLALDGGLRDRVWEAARFASGGQGVVRSTLSRDALDPTGAGAPGPASVAGQLE